MKIAESQVDLPTSLGPMRTYLYAPAKGGRYPGVAFFSEIFQVTGPVRRSAAFLAGQGFIVAVPEIYHELEPAGTVLPYDQDGAQRGNAHKLERPISAYDADAGACLDHLASLASCTGRLGAMGICIGGHLAFRAALDPRARAAACFYATDIHKRGLGRGGDDTLDRMKEVRAELLMIWGRQDPHIPPEGRRIVYDAMTAAGLAFSWHELDGEHAFIRDEGSSGRYDPELARLSWNLVIDLFKRTLIE